MKKLLLLLLFMFLPMMLFAQGIVVSWNANTESDLAGYKVYYGTTSSGSYSYVVDVGNVLTYTIKDVPELTTYYVAVTAYDTAANESVKSTEASIVTSDLTAPGVPSAPTATSGVKSLVLSWTAVTATDLAGYKIYYGIASDTYGTPVDAKKVTSYTLTGLSDNTTYYIRITAYDSAGNESAKSTEVTGKTKDTTAPTAPAAPTLKIAK